MSRRNQPYIPLYVQDFMSDEKVRECMPSSIGIYIFIMCLMHKSEEYGKILLKQKDKQNDSVCLNFAVKLAKHLPFSETEICLGIEDLVDEDVLQIEGDYLIQKRMVKDDSLSIVRAAAGKKGGEVKNLKDKKVSKPPKFAKAKTKANSENEIEDVIEDVIEYKNDLLFGKYENLFQPNQIFEATWKLWKTYKSKEHKFGYKSDISEKAALTDLYKLSEGDIKTAIEIINRSISNGWKGFFKLDKTIVKLEPKTSAMRSLMTKHNIMQ